MVADFNPGREAAWKVAAQHDDPSGAGIGLAKGLFQSAKRLNVEDVERRALKFDSRDAVGNIDGDGNGRLVGCRHR